MSKSRSYTALCAAAVRPMDRSDEGVLARLSGRLTTREGLVISGLMGSLNKPECGQGIPD